MAPQSRGSQIPPGFHSRSTPDLPTVRSLEQGGGIPTPVTSPRSPASNGTSTRYTAESEEGSLWADDDLLATSESASSSSEEEEEDRTDSTRPEDKPPTTRPLYTSRSHTQLPRHTATALFPPFYNRPPTPLPPSPSLTSLLRPSFNAAASAASAASHPTTTTPDSSDIDIPSIAAHGVYNAPRTTSTSTSTSTTNLASSALHAPLIPRASPKVPTYEYYGFAVYLGSSAAFLMYILWAYVPAPLLHHMGIYYYPNRWWALAVPCWLVVAVVWVYVALGSYNTGWLTLGLGRVECLVDECGQVAVVERGTGRIVRDHEVLGTGEGDGEKGMVDHRRRSFSVFQFGAEERVDWKAFWSMGTDAVMDVPVGGVCEILYGSGGETDEEL